MEKDDQERVNRDLESEEAQNYFQDRRKKSYQLRRSILDYGMGVIIFGFGVLFLVAPKVGLPVGIDDTFRYIFSGLCLLYGAFRVYRGARKNYFN
ncbi:hypothetical protein [Puia dinghuensis]|uniref:Uncharacterized protein n=1 Tax=Puia dinghuensis TaxID=1792502 RepID=A0A8J2UHP0_9BACT|nr:hypothetical protein [Puia dinghuensis]GGB19098.1 hypothetical protein GCM10011511_48580 [Puia dinghuensis]